VPANTTTGVWLQVLQERFFRRQNVYTALIGTLIRKKHSTGITAEFYVVIAEEATISE
jgi:hypothetical protein